MEARPGAKAAVDPRLLVVIPVDRKHAELVAAAGDPIERGGRIAVSHEVRQRVTTGAFADSSSVMSSPLATASPAAGLASLAGGAWVGWSAAGPPALVGWPCLGLLIYHRQLRYLAYGRQFRNAGFPGCLRDPSLWLEVPHRPTIVKQDFGITVLEQEREPVA